MCIMKLKGRILTIVICCVLLAATTCGIVGIVNSNMVTKKDMGDILQRTSREHAQVKLIYNIHDNIYKYSLLKDKNVQKYL